MKRKAKKQPASNAMRAIAGLGAFTLLYFRVQTNTLSSQIQQRRAPDPTNTTLGQAATMGLQLDEITADLATLAIKGNLKEKKE